MKATFQLEQHQPIVRLNPESPNEAILLAAWIRYDSNSFTVNVRRDGESNAITEIEIIPSIAE